MATYTFDFVTSGALAYPVVLISGAVDINRDGKYDTATERLDFANFNATTWRAQKTINGSPTGIHYVAHFTVGSDVTWEITVTDDEGKSHGGCHGVTVDPSTFAGGILS